MVAAAIRTIFAQPDAAHVARKVTEVATTVEERFPAVADQLTDAARRLITAVCMELHDEW